MSKEVKIVLGIIGGLIIICICAGVVTYYSARQVFTQSFKAYEEPDKIAEVARSIVDYQLPSGYSEQFGMSLFGFDMVGFGPENRKQMPQTIIFLAQFPKSLGFDKAEMERQMQQAVQRQSGRRGIQLETIDQKTVIIQDQEVPLIISEGVDSEGESMRQVSGIFKGKEGAAMLMIMGPVHRWDQNAVDFFIDSLN